MWARIWEDEAISLTTFDGVRASVATLPLARGDALPDRAEDYSATIRITENWKALAAVAGRDSDVLVTLDAWADDNGDHLPGLEPPPGLRASVDGPSAVDVSAARGTETAHSVDWAEFIANTTTASAEGFILSHDTFKAVATISAALGSDMNADVRQVDGRTVVRLTPTQCDELGFDFVSIMSWAAVVAKAEPEVAADDDGFDDDDL